ncbi:MAG: cytochrome c oxidase accessory protein CcoG [Alphaproteobacteria bacterium]|nr:cytochrome c oxidase accessory protein CcoG [Alphaproteobacteria bacterium]
MAIFHGSRQWVVPLTIHGTFTRLHKASSALLFAFLLVVPWLRWKGEPLILADLATRRMVVLGQIFTPSDGVLIMLLALAAAFSLFLFTTVFGRIWCGYFCPQSVFMINLVHPIEAWIEGTRSERMRRDAAGWSFDRAWRKAAKWAAFAAVAVGVSMSFMGFFARTELLWTGQATPGNYAVVAFFSAVWMFDFTWFREQTCNLVCPYARFQGALTDDHSLVISYDVPRGEPRGKTARARGGCIDCKKCVVVCPQGIDIRDGFQLECIACGRCIDACTDVMTKLGHPTLVRYSTQAADEGRGTRSWLRPRTLVYGGALTALLAGVVGVTVLRDAIEVQVDRAPGSLFVRDDDGFVRNTYMVHVTDRSSAEGERTYAVAVDGLPDGSQVRSRPLTLTAGQRSSTPVVVRIPEAAAARTLPLVVTVRGTDGEARHATTFKGPGADAGKD